MTANVTTGLTSAWQLGYTASGTPTVTISNPSSGVVFWSKTLTDSAPVVTFEETNALAPRASIQVTLATTERIYVAGAPGTRINIED